MTDNSINTVPQNVAEELQAALEQTAEDLNLFDMGVTIGVVTSQGQWTGASGLANLETQAATDTDDLFNIGSISKSYTSAVILKLQEQGKLILDDTLGQWLPAIAAQIPDGENLTLRQLLNGSGGLFDYLNGDERFISDLLIDYLSGSNRDWQPEDLVAYTFGKPLFSGGRSTEKWTYPNTGNVIATLIAEAATGKPFKQILAEEILQPLGLDNTFFTTEDADLEKRAKGYDDFLTVNGDILPDSILEDYSSVNTNAFYGAGSIVSSAEDVALFFNSLASGELLQPESTAEIFNYVDIGGMSQLQFGLGVYPTETFWGETRTMDGGVPGYSSEVYYFLDDETTISLLVNQSTIKSGVALSAFNASIANTLSLGNALSLEGTQNNDYLPGTAENDAIYGFAGNDLIGGKHGSDVLDGGEGDDCLKGSQGNDLLFGREGQDILDGGQKGDFLNGGDNSDRLFGRQGDDLLLGGKGQDTLNGGQGDDTLDGGAGHDLVKDTQGNNILYGNQGHDSLLSGRGDDLLYGELGNDYLNSGSGDDFLSGGKGKDTLSGGEGINTLAGGEGKDVFILSTDGTAIINDFAGGQDSLEFTDKIRFDDLTIAQGEGENASNTDITLQDKTIAILQNTNADTISPDDFIFSS